MAIMLVAISTYLVKEKLYLAFIFYFFNQRTLLLTDFTGLRIYNGIWQL